MGITNKVRGVTLHAGGDRDDFLSLSSSEDQAIAFINTTQSIVWNTQGPQGLIGFDHDIVVDNDEITFPPGAALLVTSIDFNVSNGAGNNTLTAWAQLSINGSAWFNNPRSGTQAILSPNTDTLIHHTRASRLADGNSLTKVRFVIQATSTNVSLKATAAAGDFPDIPSAFLTIHT